jgi:hypothetical protein
MRKTSQLTGKADERTSQLRTMEEKYFTPQWNRG